VTQAVIDFATAPKLSKDKIFADFNILEQAILNVLQNAIEVSPVNERITVKASKSRNLIIEISDHGPGIDKSILKDVFQPFFTTKEKGTGLGLAITKRLVELSGGNIDVKGNTPNGTVFILTIPQ
ncbi:MAG: ATP-binding protein, partial [Calditrichaeota bacterium]|nr:ATP-binding protein [Calditrichota bacterium]